MANTHETIADIIAEMRRRIAVKMSDAWYTQEEWRKLCDRLEAAWKRERAKIEADALEVGGIVGASHVREMSKNASKNAADFGQLGNAAKLREAMTTIQKLIKLHGDNEPQFALTLIAEAVYAALVAPARNCDRFATADEAFHAWNNTTDTPSGGVYVGLIDWLYASATEKEIKNTKKGQSND